MQAKWACNPKHCKELMCDLQGCVFGTLKFSQNGLPKRRASRKDPTHSLHRKHIMPFETGAWVCLGGRVMMFVGQTGEIGIRIDMTGPWGGGATLRLLGRQLPVPPPPPPPPRPGSSGQQLVAKGLPSGVHGRPMLHEHQRFPKENFVHFAPQHYP